jgi:hypothetical protein
MYRRTGIKSIDRGKIKGYIAIFLFFVWTVYSVSALIIGDCSIWAEEYSDGWYTMSWDSDEGNTYKVQLDGPLSEHEAVKFVEDCKSDASSYSNGIGIVYWLLPQVKTDVYGNKTSSLIMGVVSPVLFFVIYGLGLFVIYRLFMKKNRKEEINGQD